MLFPFKKMVQFLVQVNFQKEYKEKEKIHFQDTSEKGGSLHLILSPLSCGVDFLSEMSASPPTQMSIK